MPAKPEIAPGITLIDDVVAAIGQERGDKVIPAKRISLPKSGNYIFGIFSI